MTNSLPTALDQLLIKPVASGGAPVPARRFLNFLGGFSLSDNPAFVDPETGEIVGATDVTGSGASGGGQTTNTLSNGLNSNVPTSGLTSLRFGGPNASFSVGGFVLPGGATPASGQPLTVINTTSQAMTFPNEDLGSTAISRIATQSGRPVTLPARPSSATFIYDGAIFRWVLQNIGLHYPTTIDVRDLGADPTGVADATSAVQKAHDILPSTGGEILLADQCTFLISNLAFTKPVRIRMGRTVVNQKPGSAGALITTNSNLVVEGFSRNEAQFQLQAGCVGIYLSGTWQQNIDGAPVFITRHVGFYAGARHIDTTGLPPDGVGGHTFGGGVFEIDKCLFKNATDVAVTLAPGVFFTFLRTNRFLGNSRACLIYDNTETKLTGNTWDAGAPIATVGNVTLANSGGTIGSSPTVFFASPQTLDAGTLLIFAAQTGIVYQLAAAIVAGTTGTLTRNYNGPADSTHGFAIVNPTLTIAGGHHVSILEEEFYGYPNNPSPDIYIYAQNDAANGIVDIVRTKFGAELDYVPQSARQRIVLGPGAYGTSVGSWTDGYPTNSPLAINLRDNRFYAANAQPLASINRTSNVVTAVINEAAVGFPNAFRVGDQLWIGGIEGAGPPLVQGIQFGAAGQLAGGPVTLTSVAGNTLQWSSTGPDVATATGVGFVTCSTQAIGLMTGSCRLLIDGNFFAGFYPACNDNALTSDGVEDESGRNVWGLNRQIGPFGEGCPEFTAGGRQFSRVETQPDSGFQHASPYTRENESATGTRNRLTVNSEDGTTWGTLPASNLSGTVAVAASTSITFSAPQTLSQGTFLVFGSQPGVYYQLAAPVNASTAATLTTAYAGTPNAATTAAQYFAAATNGQTDPLGTSRAILLARAGVSTAFGTSVYPAFALAEGFALGFSNAGMPGRAYVDFWAKAGTLGSLTVWIEEAVSGNLDLYQTVPLTSSWQHYRLSYVPQVGGGLRFLPGTVSAMAGTCYVAFPGVTDGGDYVPSGSGGAGVTKAAGNRWERSVIAAGGVDLEAGAPIVNAGAITPPNTSSSVTVIALAVIQTNLTLTTSPLDLTAAQSQANVYVCNGSPAGDISVVALEFGPSRMIFVQNNTGHTVNFFPYLNGITLGTSVAIPSGKGKAIMYDATANTYWGTT
jgi:hypothetical protein